MQIWSKNVYHLYWDDSTNEQTSQPPMASLGTKLKLSRSPMIWNPK